MTFVLLGLLVVMTTAAVDFASARYVGALTAGRRHGAARWSVAQGAATAVGFVLAVKVDIRLVGFELVGLYLGTWLGGGRGGPDLEVDDGGAGFSG